MSPSTDTRSKPAGGAARDVALQHVLVVGGTPSEWGEMDAPGWAERIQRFGAQCSSLGVPWLTIRVYAAEPRLAEPAALATHTVERCVVTVDGVGDGRQRFVEALRRLPAGTEITEESVAHVLYAPGGVEPDLVVVLGPSTQLPPSLMWELAYAELVFVPVGWRDFGVDDLASAIAEFAGRRRRFGGLDPD